MKVILIFLVILFVANDVAPKPVPEPKEIVTVVDYEWEDFKRQHHKQYEDSEEDGRRRAIYLESKKKIIEHNKKYEAGLVTFKMGINQFSDLTHDEFVEKFLPSKVFNSLWFLTF